MKQSIALTLLRYDNGALFWKTQTRPYQDLKKEAGYLEKDGYRRVMFAGKAYPIHRVIWTMFYGEIPKGKFIDHLNGERADNRIENLRVATKSQNELNKKSTKGFFHCKKTGKFKAYIQRTHLGYFGTPHAARMAYLMKKLTMNLCVKCETKCDYFLAI